RKEHVGRAAPGDHPPEQVSGHLVRGEAPLTVKGTCDTEFRFDAENPPMHIPRIGVPTRLTVCRSSPTHHRFGQQAESATSGRGGSTRDSVNHPCSSALPGVTHSAVFSSPSAASAPPDSCPSA